MSNDDFEIDIDKLLNDDIPEEVEEKAPLIVVEEITVKTLKRKNRHRYRRAFSETELLEVLEHDFEIGASYHCISGGDVDALSYLKHVIRQQDIEYLLFSTWCMAMDDVLQIKEWIDKGRIKRIDAYVGEIFPGTYSKEYDLLKKVVRETGGRVCIFRNHAKIFAGIGDKFAFGVESSANINTNPRTENACITIDKEIFKFYKDFFDNVNSFTKDFKDWEKWPDN